MRLQSPIKIVIRGTAIGGEKPLIAVPLVAADTVHLLKQAKEMAALAPDLLEWRIDSYHALNDERKCQETLTALRTCINNYPLILTCRIMSEGGMRPLSGKKRLLLLQSLIRSRQVDLVDIEMANDEEFMQAVRETADPYGVRVIYSTHYFDRTPDVATIIQTLEKAEKLGADIAKVAVTPTCYEDVVTLMRATLKARTDHVKIPLITLAMGDMGRVTRIAGGLFGSDITFSTGVIASAPGQIPIDELRQAMRLLYTDRDHNGYWTPQAAKKHCPASFSGPGSAVFFKD